MDIIKQQPQINFKSYYIETALRLHHFKSHYCPFFNLLYHFIFPMSLFHVLNGFSQEEKDYGGA